MPIYEYRCEECQQVFEEWQNDFEEREVPCPVCGSSSRRLISHSAFILKGSGWYATDYSRAKASGNGNGNGSADGDKAKPAESAAQKAGKDDSKAGSAEGGKTENKPSSTPAGAAQ
ncbi:MAG: FmdB family zinc ribbon protein [Desulfonatronovibrionaceae bacterium]